MVLDLIYTDLRDLKNSIAENDIIVNATDITYRYDKTSLYGVHVANYKQYVYPYKYLNFFISNIDYNLHYKIESYFNQEYSIRKLIHIPEHSIYLNFSKFKIYIINTEDDKEIKDMYRMYRGTSINNTVQSLFEKDNVLYMLASNKDLTNVDVIRVKAIIFSTL